MFLCWSVCRVYVHMLWMWRGGDSVCNWGTVGSLICWKCNVCTELEEHEWGFELVKYSHSYSVAHSHTRAQAHTHRHRQAEVCGRTHTDLYLGVAYTIQTECSTAFISSTSVKRWQSLALLGLHNPDDAENNCHVFKCRRQIERTSLFSPLPPFDTIY